MKKSKNTCKYCKYFKYYSDFKKHGLGYCQENNIQNMLIIGYCDSFFIDENFGCIFYEKK